MSYRWLPPEERAARRAKIVELWNKDDTLTPGSLATRLNCHRETVYAELDKALKDGRTTRQYSKARSYVGI